MSKAKHTPGPWEARYMSHPVAADSFIVYDANGLPLADPCNRGRTEEERIANARLIAAAPEMLAACIELVKEAEGRIDPEDGGPGSYFLAKAAIQKAEGGSDA